MRNVIATVVLALLAGACSKSKAPAAADPASPADVRGEGAAEPVAAVQPEQPADPPAAVPADPPADPPAASDPDNDAAMEARGLNLMMELGSLLERNQKDCEAMAGELNMWFDRNTQLLIAVKKWSDGQTPEQKQGFEQRHKADMERLMKQMMPAMMACAKNEHVKQAMERMPR